MVGRLPAGGGGGGGVGVGYHQINGSISPSYSDQAYSPTKVFSQQIFLKHLIIISDVRHTNDFNIKKISKNSHIKGI